MTLGLCPARHDAFIPQVASARIRIPGRQAFCNDGFTNLISEYIFSILALRPVSVWTQYSIAVSSAQRENQMNFIDGIIPEYHHEMAQTRKVLERVPDEHWGWKPHPRSMGLGQLASHIAESQGWTASTVSTDELIMDPSTYRPYIAANRAELLQEFDKNVSEAANVMKSLTNEQLMRDWTMKTPDGTVMVQMPKIGVIRSFIISHTIHHRAQLTVYLRMKDVPLPSLYGPSADDPGM